MSPRPYAMVAYSPASSTAAMSNSAKRSTLLAVRVGGDALARGRVRGGDDRRGPVGHVLLHDEGRVRLLAELRGERQLPAGQQRGDLERHQLLPDGVPVQRARLRDRGEERARRL